MNCSFRLWADVDCGPALTPRPHGAGVVGPGRSAARRASTAVLAGGSVPGRHRGHGPGAHRPRTRQPAVSLLSTSPYGPTEQQLDGWGRQRDRLADGTTAREIQRDLLPLLLSDQTLAQRPDVVATRSLSWPTRPGRPTSMLSSRLQATRIDERPGLRDGDLSDPGHRGPGGPVVPCRPAPRDRLVGAGGPSCRSWSTPRTCHRWSGRTRWRPPPWISGSPHTSLTHYSVHSRT